MTEAKTNFWIILTEHPLCTIFSIAILVRSINIFHLSISGGDFVIEDSFFLTFSKEWARAFGLMEGIPAGAAYVERVPGYPLLVALMQGVGLSAPVSIATINSFFDSVTCVILGLLGCQLDRRVGLVAGLLSAFWPNLIIHSSLVLNDTLFVLLFAGLLYWAAKFLATPSLKAAFISGILVGLAVCTRPIAQFLVPVLAIAMAGIAHFHGVSKRRIVLLVLVFFVPTVLTLLPIYTHNILKFGSLSLSAQTGTHLAYWVLPPVKKIETGMSFEETKVKIRKSYEAELKRRGGDESNPFDVNNILTNVALSELRNSSTVAIATAWLQGMALNIATPAVLIDTRVRTFSGQSFYELEAPNLVSKVLQYLEKSTPLYLFFFFVGAFGSILSLIFGIYGLFILHSLRPWAAIFATLAVFYFLLINGPVASPKYRLPIEPVMIICASLGLVQTWKKMLLRKNKHE
ncbi:MAG: glycosyltransferase family 39 protein [Pseudomonadota bacterium]|nr:glycosyltransferase family 39 protein [Pseudomonadota bacterium]